MGSDILSVGIDIGTSTTQVIFSRISMENTSGYFAVPHIAITDKEVIYKSDIYTTPLKNSYLIDGDAVRDIVSGEFSKAGFSPSDTQTGAVIITGESARKENSALVLEKLSDLAGEFVVSTAGPDLESVIAGKGSGAQSYSDDNACVAANLDIGGGTTNIVIFDCGKVIAKGCLDIGGRLVKLDGNYRVSYISPSAKRISDRLGLDIEEGKTTDVGALKRLCGEMAAVLEQALVLAERSEAYESAVTGGSSALTIDKPIGAICFSGGVADCIYTPGGDYLRYGDIGVLLGEAIRAGRLYSDFRLIPPRETIRATVVGAGTYTTSISGSTIAYSHDILPLKNVPVLKLTASEEAEALKGNSDFIRDKVGWFLAQSDSDLLILALRGASNPTYDEIKLMARAIGGGMDLALQPDKPLLIITETDIAKALGQAIIRLFPGRKVVSVDSVSVEDGDFVDMGRPLMNGVVIPVVVKTLIFG